MPDPKVPNRNNPFEQFSNSLIGFLKKVETRDKKRDEKLERLVKQMIVYFQLLERAFKNNQVISKGGTQDSTKAGVDKLVRLMSNLDSNVTTTVNKFIKGERLVASEKADIAKLTGDIKDALSESGEKIGIPIKDLLNNFKEILANDKLDANFRIDVVRFLKDYSEEDIALSQELKNLLDKISNSNKLIDEDIIKLNIELDKNIQEYTSELKEATFAPFMKINKEINESNILLEDIVDILSENQRQESLKKESLTDKSKQKTGDFITGLVGDLTQGLARVTGIGMAESGIPALQNIAPLVAGAGGLVGMLTKDYLGTKGVKGLVGDLKSLGKTIPKVLPALSGVVTAFSGALIGLLGKFKFFGKGLSKIAEPIGKIAGKGLGKGVLKKIPIVGAIAGGAFAVDRAFEGDFFGAGLEAASGIAGTFPGLGTAASLGIDTLLAGRDLMPQQMSSDETFDKAFKHILKSEGGLVDDKSDKGGRTNLGVTQKTYDSYRKGMNLPTQDVKNITKDEAKNIYKRYWIESGASTVKDSRLATSVFDMAINSGSTKAKQYLDKSGGDYDKFMQMRGNFYNRIVEKDPTQAKFLKGWMNRLSNLDKFVNSDDFIASADNINMKSIPESNIELPPLNVPKEYLKGEVNKSELPQIIPQQPQLQERKLKSDSDIINVLNLNGIFT